MSMPAPVNLAAPTDDGLALRLPLSGLHLVEASAGTGKTFALTAWMLRLLLERGVALPDLLAVTFTRAATAELRERIRRRLRGAERLFAGEMPRSDEERQTATLLEQACTGQPGAEALARSRLAAALVQLDEASVSTIHGFCQRALREFGFIAGSIGDESVIDDARDAWDDVAADLWRSANRSEDGTAHLQALWKTPAKLAKSLKDLCSTARELLPAADESPIAAWLHALRLQAHERFDGELSRRRQRSQDQLLERMHAATHDPRFAAAVVSRWPVMLVDEFQDTDPQQWAIFRRLYKAGAARADRAGMPAPLLGLVGDPKQAIYAFRGGDLGTYLLAKQYVSESGSAEVPGISSLGVNYRSRPALLGAIEALFTQNQDPFRAGIDFPRVVAPNADREDALTIDGMPPPGLTVHWLPHSDNYRTNKPEVDAAIAMTVREIVDLLNRGTIRKSGRVERVSASDIAVLVQTNKQVARIREALAAVGLSAATQSNESVFASSAANEVLCLLEACAHPGDSARVRAALATRLLGLDAAEIAALDERNDDGAPALPAWMSRFEVAGLAWQQRGPLPALLPFLDGRYVGEGPAAARLGVVGGARLLTDALHLAELLQERSEASHGTHELLRWFARQCAVPPEAEELALRIDAAGDAIQVLTLHKAKGLEYPIVFLPFAAFERGGGPNDPLRQLRVRDGSVAANYFYCSSDDQLVLGSESRHAFFLEEHKQQECAESLRLFYVGLTRAQFAVHVTWGCNRSQDFNASPLAWLLAGGARAGSKKGETKVASMATLAQDAIRKVAASCDGAIAVVQMARAEDVTPEPLRDAMSRNEGTPAALAASGLLPRGGGQYSFSGLRSHHREALPARGADDEAAAPTPMDIVATSAMAAEDRVFLGGADFGNVVHEVLEEADFAAWDGATEAPDAGAHAKILKALARHDLPETPEAAAQVGALVARALNVALPGTGTLARLPATRRVAEMEFHFRLGATRLPALYALLAEHGYARASTPSRGSIEGLMHGYIDLLYRDDDGAHWVLDYKTNRLADYAPEACARAVADSDYDLQYLIYLVAVRRWLRLRLGDAYDPARDLGGAVYLFVRGIALRGLDAHGRPADAAAGIHRDRPKQALIDGLDALFDGGAA